MTERTTHEDICVLAIKQILKNDTHVIQALQSSPRPITQYVSVKVINDKQVGRHAVLETDNSPATIIQQTQTLREITFSINVFYDDAMYLASDIKQGFLRESISKFLRAKDYGVGNSTDILPLDRLISGSQERRAQFDLILYAFAHDTDEIESIDSVTINGDLLSSGDHHKFKIEVNASE